MLFAIEFPTKIKIKIAQMIYFFISPFFANKQFLVNRKGINYFIDLTEGIDLSLFLFGSFQKYITHNKLYSLPEEAVVLDIGANFGVLSLQFAKTATKGKVYAFEPTHYGIKKLQKNLKLNPEFSDRVIPIQAFVSQKDERRPSITAFASWKIANPPRNIHPIHGGTSKSTRGVPSLTLDTFCQQKKLKRLDFIKIDTDGHEYEVFLGAKKTLQKFRPFIIFEVGDYLLQEKGLNFSFFLDYFKKLKYNLFDSQSQSPITPDNFNQIIPKLGTIDILAIPIKKFDKMKP